MKCAELAYSHDSTTLFAKVAAEPWSMFLDSAYPTIHQGRYDIIVARPEVTIETTGQITTITSRQGQHTATGDPFELLQHYLGKPTINRSELPFCGGALGYFAYDLGRRIEQLPDLAHADVLLPELAIGIYDWAVIVDHHLRSSWLASFGRFAETAKVWPKLLALFNDKTPAPALQFDSPSQFAAEQSADEYYRAFATVKRYIRAGDCYQVNLAQRFSAEFSGSSWACYCALRQLNPAPFSAYLHLPRGAVLSTSPEQFLSVVDRQVTTKPIKGTIRRSDFTYEDNALAERLLESEKDRAENLMIVDLLRNDLSRVCEPGSVTVPKLFALETYATVHHLVSTVSGRLRQAQSAITLLKACFPGGSITGAPKLRAMEIIEELEPVRRSVYCGSIAYLGFDGNMDSNICIRTLVHYQDKLYLHTGGGIVWDSDPEAEYKECFAKAAALLKLSTLHNH